MGQVVFVSCYCLWDRWLLLAVVVCGTGGSCWLLFVPLWDRYGCWADGGCVAISVCGLGT